MLNPIPIFNDNYVWTLQNAQQAIVVDPGDAAPVIDYLQKNQLQLQAILITHHHWDHVGGVAELCEKFPVPVYGPATENIPGLTDKMTNGDRLTLLDFEFTILNVPGHTLGHIAYYTPGLVFCGDTLFSAGCGRLFEGTPSQMHHSLSRLAELPSNTKICCTHEYTLNNLKFARLVEPNNTHIAEYQKIVEKKRQENKPSLPSTVIQELKINPFLRCGQPAVTQAAETKHAKKLATTVEVFTVLRQWKDTF